MKRYSTVFLSLGLCTMLSAQSGSLNPTVQVTNAYQAHFSEMDKPSVRIEIPDSLYKFNLDFDYSGFENQYRGSADFNPFVTELEIAARQRHTRKLYLLAGAGYALAPELDLSCEIASGKVARLGAFASHDSYFGKYAGCLERGGDARTKGGLDLRFDWKKANLVLTGWYDGVLGKDSDAGVSHYHSACGSLALNSNLDPSLSAFRYRLLANYSYGSGSFGGKVSSENVVDVDGFVDLVFGRHIVELDVDFDLGSASEYSGVSTVVRPRYIFSSGALSLAAGPAVGWCGASGGASRGRALDIFPSVHLKLNAVPQKLIFYLRSDMESRLFTMRDAYLMTRFYIPDFQKAVGKEFHADLGLKGDFSGKFTYDLSAGYLRRSDCALFSMGENALEFVHVPLIDNFFAKLRLKAVAGPFSIGGGVQYRKYLKEESLDIVPPTLSADAFIRLNLHRRWILEITGAYTSSYRSNGFTAAGFVDVGARAEYNFTSRFGVYVKGSNLLGQKLQTVPGYARRDVCVLGGIVLTI